MAQTAERARLRGVDGLRAVAASSVLVYHVWQFAAPDGRPMELPVVSSVVPHLWHGVTLFFVLSGFLLFRPFAAAVIRDKPFPDLRRYLRNRALRILPAYWVILLIVGVVLNAAVLHRPDMSVYEGRMDPGLLVINALLLQNYTPQTLYTGIGPAWSLAVEAVWYLLLPLLGLVAVLAARRARRDGDRLRAVLVPVAVMLVVALSGKAASLYLVDWSTGVERSFWGLADFFAYGMVVAVLSVELQDGRLRLPSWWRRGAVAAIFALVAVAVVGGADNMEGGGLRNHGYNVAMAMSCALLLALVVLPDASRPDGARLVRVLDSRVLTAIGAGSYSLFLWHEPMGRWVRNQGLTLDGWVGFFFNVGLVAVVSGVLAFITYRAVERPAMRLRFDGKGLRRVRRGPPPEQERAAP